jgi:hypothetical protein
MAAESSRDRTPEDRALVTRQPLRDHEARLGLRHRPAVCRVELVPRMIHHDLDCHWVLLGGDAFNVPENAHRLSGVDVGGAGAGRELTVGSAGAAPVVVRDEVGAVTVVEIGLVEPYTSAATTVAEMAAIIQGHGVPPLLFCSRLRRRSSSGWRVGSAVGLTRLTWQRFRALSRTAVARKVLDRDGRHALTNVPTISVMQGMLQYDQDPL